MKIGIQGGKGSFNEEAVHYYIAQNSIKDFEIVYLYTTEAVLKALSKKQIDIGQFAIHNSTGGVVWETLTAMGKYKFNVEQEFSIIIAHALMIRKDAKFEDIDTIMTHPQVLKQCKNSLYEKYPHLTLTSGKGDLIDHSNVAKHLSEKKLNKNIATMGSKILAKIYDLQIVEDNLQDNKHNYTSFLIVTR